MTAQFYTQAEFQFQGGIGWQWVRAGYTGPPPTPPPGVALLAPQDPYHPALDLRYLISLPPPIAAVQPAIVLQEPVQLPPSLAIAGVPPTVFVPPSAVRRIALVTQEQPDQPITLARAGVPPVLPISAVRRIGLTTQEQPDQPQTITRAGLTPSTHVFAPPNTRVALQVQEQPWHPGPLVLRGSTAYLPPILRPTGQAIVWQQQPDEPKSFAVRSVRIDPLVLHITRIARVVQEQPDFKEPFGYFTPMAFVHPVPLEGRQRLVMREQPWHPEPYLHGSSFLAQLAGSQVPFLQVFV